MSSAEHGACPVVDLVRLERGYPKEVGPKEADDLRIGLLDLSSTVVGDINICGPSAPPGQPSLDVARSFISGSWAINACVLHQPGASGPDLFGGAGGAYCGDRRAATTG